MASSRRQYSGRAGLLPLLQKATADANRPTCGPCTVPDIANQRIVRHCCGPEVLDQYRPAVGYVNRVVKGEDPPMCLLLNVRSTTGATAGSGRKPKFHGDRIRPGAVARRNRR